MMKHSKKLLGTLALAGSVACGSAEDGRTVAGTLDLAGLGRTKAEMVASDRSGLITTAAVGADGRFDAALVPGQTYAIAFRDPTTQKVFANLVFGEATTRSGAIRVASAGETIELGTVRRASTDDSEHSCRDVDDTPAGEDPAGQPDGGTTDPAGGGDGVAVTPSFLVVADDNPSADDLVEDAMPDGDGDDRPDVFDEDDDDDGLCDDSDDLPGDDDGGEDGDDEGEAELPYDVKLQIGDTFTLVDAFLEKGPVPAEILSVEMEGGSWRLAELQSGTPFEVTQADCDHEGNRDIGRDRIFVAWRNANGTREIDHLDLRYCDD